MRIERNRELNVLRGLEPPAASGNGGPALGDGASGTLMKWWQDLFQPPQKTARGHGTNEPAWLQARKIQNAVRRVEQVRWNDGFDMTKAVGGKESQKSLWGMQNADRARFATNGINKTATQRNDLKREIPAYQLDAQQPKVQQPIQNAQARAYYADGFDDRSRGNSGIGHPVVTGSIPINPAPERKK